MALKIFLSTTADTSGPFAARGNRFVKDFIREGKWVLDTPEGPRMFPVTKERIKRWEETFKLMRERGISVPLTVDHVEVRDPATGELIKRKLRPGQADAQRGFVKNLVEKGGSGECEVEPADEESTKLLQRCPEASLEMTQDFIDGHGNYYKEAITAITLTPKPVIPGQRLTWEKIAASREIQEADESTVVCLSAEPFSSRTPTPALESRMELLALLRKLFNLPENAPEADVKVKLSRVVEDKSVIITAEEAKAIAEIKPLQEKLVVLSRERDDAKAAAAKAAGMPDVDEDAQEMAADAFQTRIKALTITPAQKTLLSRALGVAGSRNVVMLSRKAAKHVGLSDPLAETILQIFEAGKPEDMLKLLNEQSKAQRVTMLSRDAVDPNGNQPAFDESLQKRMIERANGAKDSSFSL